MQKAAIGKAAVFRQALANRCWQSGIIRSRRSRAGNGMLFCIIMPWGRRKIKSLRHTGRQPGRKKGKI